MTDEELVQTLIGEVLTQYEADSILKSIGNLKSENDELKSRLTHANEECLKWHERAQNLLKDSGGSISGYEKKISDLQAENAAMRERLEKAVELPCKVGDNVFCIVGIDPAVEEFEVEEILIKRTDPIFAFFRLRGIDIGVKTSCVLSQFGKRWFTELEAAEARLAELKGDGQ